MTTPAWLETTVENASLLDVPDGLAWGSVLRIVQVNLPSFTETDHALLLGLIEDWGRSVSWRQPYPDGAESVAAVAHWLLPNFDSYGSKEQRKRTLRVIAKIPNADRERFTDLLQRKQEDEVDNREAEEFREIVFESIEGMPAARDCTELFVSMAKEYLLLFDSELGSEWWEHGSDLQLENLFGIKQGRSHDYFPASAYHGPFLHLLRYHPIEGLNLIISIFNHSADWYAHPRVHSEIVEPPVEIILTFANGTSRKQCCNDRLWLLYRGLSVGPYVLQSLLMALEKWLLEFAAGNPGQVDALLQRILSESQNAALTAVVASVATAFPRLAGETLLVLLRSPLCIQLDRGRLGREPQAPSKMARFMPGLRSGHEVFEEERKDADELPHRSHDLEAAIANLQLGPLANRVIEILDRYRAEMPAVETQGPDDRIWRLALHRMDLRQYTVADDAVDDSPAAENQEPLAEGKRYLRLNPKDPEPDVKAMMDQNAQKLHSMNVGFGLLMWGVKVFGREENAVYDPDHWRQRLQEARGTSTGDSGNQYDLSRGGPGFVAAIGVRDHWDDMSDDERNWCLNLVCTEVEREGDHWNQFARMQRNSMSADRACAWVLPLLLGKSLIDAERQRVREVFAVALTHASDEVRSYTTLGIGRHLWSIDRELAFGSVNALASEAIMVEEAAAKEARRPHTKRKPLDQIEAAAANIVRRDLLKMNAGISPVYQRLDIAQWFGAKANVRILSILAGMPTDSVAVGAFERLSQTEVAWWDADDNRQRNRHERRSRPNHEIESALSDLLNNFLLRTTSAAASTILQPILNATDRHPREVHWLLLGLITIEDQHPNTPQFWAIWTLIADKVRSASWLPRIDADYAHGHEVISALFLGSWWKAEVRHWRSLEGHSHLIHTLFDDLPASSTVLNDYLRFLYHVGEQSLPEAFIRISQRLHHGDFGQMLRKGNTVYLLEVLLQRYVYGRPLELKRRSELRHAVLNLLNILVEQGSSAAFRMRDDFVTPMSPEG